MDPILFKAAQDANLDVLRENAHRLPLQINGNGTTLLHVMARYHDFGECVHEIIEGQRSDVKRSMLMRTNLHGETALYVASRHGHSNIVQALMDCARTYDREDEHASDSRITEQMLRATNQDEDTALHIAARKNCIAVVNLTRQGDELGWTPLHYASYRGSVQLVRVLLDADREAAYVTAIEDDNKIALHAAACADENGVMEELLTYCSDCWDTVTSKRQNVLHLSIQHKAEKGLSFITTQSWVSSVINQRDEEGNTPLHLYIKNLAEDFDASLLITHPSIDLNIVNSENLTPYDLALKCQRIEYDLIEVLHEAHVREGR